MVTYQNTMPHDFVIVQPVRNSRLIHLGSTYRTPRYKWLSWLLSCCGLLKTSTYVHYYDTYTRVTIHTPDLKETIYQVVRALAVGGFGRPKKLYMSEHAFRVLASVDIHRELKLPLTIWGIELVVTPFLQQDFLPVY